MTNSPLPWRVIQDASTLSYTIIIDSNGNHVAQTLKDNPVQAEKDAQLIVLIMNGERAA